MDFIEIAKTDEIPTGKMKAFVTNGKDILVVNYEGNFYAIGALCTHQKGELAKGKLEGKVVTCPRHDSKFDVTTGKNLAGPKIGFIRLKTSDEPKYEVKVEGNTIKVGL